MLTGHTSWDFYQNVSLTTLNVSITREQNKFDWSQQQDLQERPLLSYGPCQFPTLGLIVEREWYC